jgi:hypothetical protein
MKQTTLFEIDERPSSAERKRAKNRRAARSWYQRHPEEAKRRHAQYVERNKARLEAKRKEWYQRNRARLIAKATQRHRERGRGDYLTRLARQYGTTVECLLEVLGKRCPICRKRTATALDHCHKTGQFRGGLCDRCNHGLGQFEDDVSSLRRAIKYLQQCDTKHPSVQRKTQNIVSAEKDS